MKNTHQNLFISIDKVKYLFCCCSKKICGMHGEMFNVTGAVATQRGACVAVVLFRIFSKFSFYYILNVIDKYYGKQIFLHIKNK